MLRRIYRNRISTTPARYVTPYTDRFGTPVVFTTHPERCRCGYCA